MRKLITTAVVACMAALAVAAPASAATEAGTTICTGNSTWTVDLLAATADLFVTTNGQPGCKAVGASQGDDGNLHLNTADQGYSGGYPVSLTGVNVIGTNSFAGVAHRGQLGHGPVEAVNGNLNAVLEAVNPTAGGYSKEIHTGLGSCGTNCYSAAIRWVWVGRQSTTD